MKEPERITHGPQDDVAGSLLRAMRHDRPSSKVKAATLAALGVGAAVGTGATAATALAKGSGALVKGASLAQPLALLKWLGLGVVVGGVTVGTASQVLSVPEMPVQSSAVRASVSVRAVRSPSREPLLPDQEPEPPASASTEIPSRSPVPLPVLKDEEEIEVEVPRVVALADSSLHQDSAEPPLPSATAPASLTDEVRSLDRVRTALQRGDGASGLRLLEEYRASFPRAQLGSEALLLNIQALELTGNHAAATSMANQFVMDNPNSALVPRIRSLVGGK